MKLTILGGCGAYPTARQPCGGYLVEHEGYTLLVDPGYAVLPRLLATHTAADVDAVLISHGHLDHCADLNPLLRARVLNSRQHTTLPVFAPRGALTRVLDADRVRAVARGADVGTLRTGSRLQLGPFTVDVAMLPHHLPNAGMRIAANGKVLVYTGDSGDCSARADLARDADVLLAEATYAGDIPPDEAPYLSSVAQVAELALAAGVRQTVLTHQWPGEPAERALAVARTVGLQGARVAFAGLTVDLSPRPTTLAVAPVRGRRALIEDERDREVPVLPRRAVAASS